MTRVGRSQNRRDRGEENGQGNEVGRRRFETSTTEWIVAGVSALVVLAALGLLLHDALDGPTTPALIDIRTDSIHRAAYGYLVTFTARNRGGETAADVIVEGELSDDAGSVQTSQTTLDYVPAEGERSGGLFFTEDPGAYRLTLRALGFGVP